MSPVLAGPTTRKATYQTPLIMPLFAPPLIPLFFFSGFTVAGIYAQDSTGTTTSNGGAIAGGIVACIAVTCIIVVALFLYRRRRRRRSLPQPGYAPSAGDAGTYNPHVNRVAPMSGQETVTSPLPGTSTSMSRHYVRSHAPTVYLQLYWCANMCSFIFRPIEPGRPVYVPRAPRSFEPIFHLF